MNRLRAVSLDTRWARPCWRRDVTSSCCQEPRPNTDGDVEHRICPRRRISSAPAVITRAATARKGCAGANQLIAPEYPSASSAILLHTGQPTANQTRTPPAIPSRLGMAGGVLVWFAVGCPVCNKIALLALGYSGAINWFAPAQPFLAVAALVMTAGALLMRLRGQILCSTSPSVFGLGS